LQFEPPPDSLLFFAKGDTFEEDVIDVIEATSTIAETAFVLPCIEEQGDEFPFSHEDAKYFLVLPPQHTWIDVWSLKAH
jgi:hypothetical protein